MNDDRVPETPAPGLTATAPPDDRIAALQAGLLAWYAVNQRDLPWRRTRDPYHILVAEMMLQQTQVPRVLPRYHAWLERFPTLAALAAAPTADVLREWSGLGYNSRAVRLQQIARRAVERYGGRLPETIAELLALPGIGDYTARAVACFAYERDVPVLDTNVKRVLHRVLVGPEIAPPDGPPPLSDRALWALAARAVPAGRGYDWNQALMDFGSSVCTARKPACVVCPLRPICRAAPAIHTLLAARDRARREAGAAAAVPFTSTNRHFRGQALRVLGGLPGRETIALDDLGPLVKPGYTAAERSWLYALVDRLHRDGLVRVWGAPMAGGAIREARAAYDGAGDGDASGAALADVRVSLPEG